MTPEQFRFKIWNDPEYFVREILGVVYWRKQVEILLGIKNNRRLSVSGCTASSKTVAGAMALLWWLSSLQPSRVFCVAPSLRQVELNIWGYARQFWKGSRIPLGGEFFTNEYKLGEAWYAHGFSPDSPEKAKGIHGANDLILLDDAQGVESDITLALENAMAGGNARLVLFFNKNVLSGEAYDSCNSKKNLYTHISIPASCTPNVRTGKDIIPGMIKKETVEEWGKTYGIDSNFYRTMVLDQFPTQEPNTVIPIDWVEKAMKREIENDPDKQIYCGLDVAYYGDDRSVFTAIRGRTCLPLKEVMKQDPIEVGEWAYQNMRMLNASQIWYDIIGFGAGSGAYLKKQEGIEAHAVNVAQAAQNQIENEKDPAMAIEFDDLRSEVWWTGREALDPLNKNCVALPKDLELMAELSSARYEIIKRGEHRLIRVESKDTMKKRLKAHGLKSKSPDKADSFNMAAWGRKNKKKISREVLVSVYNSED